MIENMVQAIILKFLNVTCPEHNKKELLILIRILISINDPD